MRAARAVELGELLPGMRKGLTSSHVKERRMDSPRGSSLCPSRSAERGYAPAQGSPGARKRHAGKYGESTPSRQRGGGGGNASPLPTRSRCALVLERCSTRSPLPSRGEGRGEG